HPGSCGPLILVGCGTFDPVARAQLKTAIAERMSDDVRARLEQAEQLAADEGLKAKAQAMSAVYSYELFASPHDDDKVDARAHHQPGDDMVPLQAAGTHPAASPPIDVPVLLLHGAYDPPPGRLILASLRPYLPQLEYRELERCGHYPWLEKWAAGTF